MYEELVKSLRICGRMENIDDNCIAFHDECCEAEPLCMYELMRQAADAIEELTEDNAALNGTVINLLEQIAELSKPRWIPVTERLPEEDGEYLVCGRWRGKPMQIWICERVNLGPVFGWANRAENPVISHWMPLPEPPKEETE